MVKAAAPVELRRHVVALLLLAASHLGVALYWQPALDIFPIDDPYIHLVYGASLAAGEGFAFNRGEPSLGTSSPLWTLAVAAVTLVSAPASDHVVAVLCLLGSGLLLASGGLLYLLVFSALRRSGARAANAATTGLLSALVVTTSGNLLWISFSGMETTLFLAAALLALCLHASGARPIWIGASLATAVLTRVCGLYLVAAFLVQSLVADRTRRRATAPVLLIPAAAFAAVCAFSFVAFGTALPTTVGGKKASYVEGDLAPIESLAFVGRYFAFLVHQPAYLLLVALLLGYALHRARDVASAFVRKQPSELATRDLLALWALLHLAVFALTFRSLLHYGRYFVPLSVAAVAVGALLAHALAEKKGEAFRFAPAGLLALALAANLWDLPRWQRLYHHDVRHVRETYVRSAEWVRDHTAQGTVIAAYDIGALKYYSGRRIVDLFGLLDPRVHPLLRERDVSSYVRDSGAEYLLYLQEPNTEHHTRIYLAEYGEDELLEQRFVTAFRSEPYPQPTVTQSFGVAAYAIDGWHRTDPDGLRRQFVAEAAELDGVEHTDAHLGDRWQLVGVQLDTDRVDGEHVLRRVLDVPTLGFHMTLYWRALATDTTLPLAETLFVDSRTDATAYSMRRVVAHGRIEGLVRQGEIVREPHFVWLPTAVPDAPLSIRVRAFDRRTGERLSAGPSGESEIEVGVLRIVPAQPVGLPSRSP